MNKQNSYTIRAQVASQVVTPRTVPVYAPGRAEAREKVRRQAARRQEKIVPRWLVFVIMTIMTFILCITLNIKSFSQLSETRFKQNQVQSEIEHLKNNNLALAEEVNRLQNDPAAIERAARERLNMVRANEKVLVSAQ